MQPHEKEESTVIDLAVINPQAQQGQQRRRSQQQQQTGSSSPIISPLSTASNVFDDFTPTSPENDTRGESTGAAGNRASKQPKGTMPGEKKDCPRHAKGHTPNRLTTRDLNGKRVISLFYGSDVTLFDTIMAYKLGNPDKLVDDAIDTFGEHQGADALANIIYETQAFDMVFKHPIPEYLRKIPDAPPTLDANPSLSDIEIDSTSSAALARKEARLEKQRQFEEEQKRQRELDSAQAKDIEAAAVTTTPRDFKEEWQERRRIRFKKALLQEGLIIEEEPSIEGEDMFMKVYTPFWRLCIEAQRLRYKIELTSVKTDEEKASADAATNKAESQGFLTRYFWRLIQKADNVSLSLRPESLLFKANKLRQYVRAEKHRRWSDIVRHGGGIKSDGSGVGCNMGSDGKDGFFGTARRGNLTESIIIYCRIHTKHGDRPALKSVMEKGAYKDMYTLHDGSYKSKVQPVPNRRTLLFNSWVRSRHSQPLEEIRFYYGEKIALYFAWIEHYTRWLVSAAIAGVLFLIFGLLNYFYLRKNPDQGGGISGQLVSIFDNALSLPFALFMSIWSALFIEHWKRKSNVLAYEWNTLDYERRERARPEFRPTGTRVSPVTGKKELYYPRYRQIISVSMSVVVVLVSIAIVIVSVGSLIIFNTWLKNSHENWGYGVSAITAVLNLVVIMILGTVYARIAKVLTDNENHRRMTQYEDALVTKRFLFDFINFYSTMVYIAFFKDVDITLVKNLHDSCGDGGCMGELTIQLAIVFVGKQFANQAQELLVPQLQKWWNKKDELAEKAASLKGKYKNKHSSNADNVKKPPQWAKDDILPSYDPQMFEEYRELVIQFGFCTLFIIAFPVAPIFALLNNVLEIRVDAYKLLTQHRRPIAQGAQDIGSWETILMTITHISVFTNACLIAFQSTWMKENVFNELQSAFNALRTDHNMENDDFAKLAVLCARLLFIFIFEHAVFFLKFVIAHLVRDTPKTVKLAIERENYFARLALDDEEPAMDEVLEDLDDDTDESDDENAFAKRFIDDFWTNGDDKEKDARTSRQSGEGDNGDQEDEENEEELEAFKPETRAALRRRQQRQRRKQNANKAHNEV
ncbi:hypothetical protein BGX28_004062 [Mortierella sp. GBA30]|nr:hypothetical protein BGX28_004062 [Mortierella sp. GBA30]